MSTSGRPGICTGDTDGEGPDRAPLFFLFNFCDGVDRSTDLRDVLLDEIEH